MQVRVHGLPDWEIHESRQTTQLFSTKYWGGFHAELFQIKVDSTSGIMHSMVICEKSGRRSFHLRREFFKVHTEDTSKYWCVSCYRKVKPSRERSVCYIKDLFKGTWSLAEIFFQTKLLSRVSPRFCRFLSSHFRAKTIATLHFQPECFPLHSNASGRTSVFWLPWAMLKIFHWTCLFLHFYKVLCKPYSILWWYKVNEKMKQQREQNRWWKLKSEFCIVWKSSFRGGKKHKNETLRPATKDTKSPKNVLIPPIKPTRESIRVLLATSKTFAMLSSCWSTNVHADH